MKKKVLVAMSGGVDSSITAYLLKEKGYTVIGATMRLWSAETGEEADENSCCSSRAVEDAERVAHQLDIPFHVVDFQELFKNHVIDYFVNAYQAGRTPNPCVACNRFIKFSALLDKAEELGADYLATGHYARITFDQEYGRYLIRNAADRTKDQTYVLYGLTQHQLEKILMPLGEYSKKQIREIAAALDYAVADKPESQEICFIPDNDYRSFIASKNKPGVPGDFISVKGDLLGTHRGIANYTIGQRKGLGLALGYPAYVVAIDAVKNQVIVGTESDLYADALIAEDNNFILFDRLEKPMNVEAKIRYNFAPVPALLTPTETDRVRVTFDQPVKAITPGQSVVYYKGDLLVGGGTIIGKETRTFS